MVIALAIKWIEEYRDREEDFRVFGTPKLMVNLTAFPVRVGVPAQSCR